MDSSDPVSEVCMYYLKGKCKKGKNCKYLHKKNYNVVT